MDSMKKANFQYWVCQVGGWGAYSGVGLATAVMESGWRPSITIGYALFFLYSIAATHLLREVIHRRNWMSLPLLQVLTRFAGAAIAIGAIQTVLVVAIYSAIEGKLGVWHEPSSIGFMFLGVSVINTIWTTLYLTVTSLRKSREARRQEDQLNLALSNAELRALEAQVNPHFLFNCLNSIRGMISEDAPQAQDMITKLANILRYNLQKDRLHTVTLAREMEAVADYLALESIRFEDRLRVHIAMDDAAGKSEVPSMLLQTLVENAIKHGVEEAPSGGDLFIRAGLQGGALRIQVENPGNLRQPREGSMQIGLANARERLRILYGENASLALAACGEGRVAATLLIPAGT